MAVTFSLGAKIAAHTAILDFIDSGASPGYIEIFDASDNWLKTIELAHPCGEINGETGTLTFYSAASGTDGNTGTASVARLANGNNDECFSVSVSSGDAPAPGSFVLSTTTILDGAEISLISATLG